MKLTCSIQNHSYSLRSIDDQTSTRQRTTHSQTPCSLSRRHHLALLSSISAFISPSSDQIAHASEIPSDQHIRSTATTIPDYTLPGPLLALRLPNLEHTCTTCDAPAERCRVKIHAWAPKGGGKVGLAAPFPLAIISPGFLVSSDQYFSYCERLASWGYVAVTYDRTQDALAPVSDIVAVQFLQDLIDWCRTSVPLSDVCDTHCVYLIGHSRGGKISSLAAAADSRVKALFLIDPVDVTKYTPLNEEFPSAVEALQNLPKQQGLRSLPLAVVGSGRGGDCVPSESNYSQFFKATEAPAWEIQIPDSGHLQFLDSRNGTAMDLVCAAGRIADETVAEITSAAMIAWGESMVKNNQLMINMEMDGDKMGGRFTAGFAPFNSLQALYSTESSVRRRLKAGGQDGVEIITRLKNFVM